jgi:hypothetical protein
VLRKILGLKMDEVTGCWRKQHNEELLSLYSSPSIIRMIKSRRMRWAGHIACIKEKRDSYKIGGRTPGRKRPLGKLRHRSVDNIKMDPRFI